MNAFEALLCFKAQVKHHTGLKTVLVPTPIQEAAPVVRIAVRKIVLDKTTKVVDKTLRLTVALEASAESDTGLRQAIEAIEALNEYATTANRLENEFQNAIPNTRITWKSNLDDGLLEDPDSGKIVWVRDEHFVEITLA